MDDSHGYESKHKAGIFEDNLAMGTNMLQLLVHNGRSDKLTDLLQTAEDHFKSLLDTYPRIDSSKASLSDLSIGSVSDSENHSITSKNGPQESIDFEIHHMILQEYLNAINTIRERYILSQADRLALSHKAEKTTNVINVRNDRGEDLFSVLDQQQYMGNLRDAINLYKSLYHSKYPLIRYSARYNHSVCLFNSGQYEDSLSSFEDLENHIELYLTHDQSSDKSVNLTNIPKFHEYTLEAVRSTISLLKRLREDTKLSANRTNSSTKSLPTALSSYSPRKSAFLKVQSSTNTIRKDEPKSRISVASVFSRSSIAPNIKVPDLSASVNVDNLAFRYNDGFIPVRDCKSQQSTSLESLSSPTLSSNSKNNIPNHDSALDSKIKESLIEPALPSEKPSITVLTYSYERLKGSGPYPPGVQPNTREEFLSAEEFERIFSMTKENWFKIPMWRRISLKKQVNLF